MCTILCSDLFVIPLYLFPITAVKNCQKISGLKQHKFIITDLDSESDGFHWAEIQMSPGCFPLWRVWGTACFLVFTRVHKPPSSSKPAKVFESPPHCTSLPHLLRCPCLPPASTSKDPRFMLGSSKWSDLESCPFEFNWLSTLIPFCLVTYNFHKLWEFEHGTVGDRLKFFLMDFQVQNKTGR